MLQEEFTLLLKENANQSKLASKNKLYTCFPTQIIREVEV